MLDQTMQNRITKLVEVKFTERRRQFPIELVQIDSQAAMRGMFHSSVRVQQTQQAHERELEVRAVLAWESLVRVHRILGQPLSETLRDDLKIEIRRHIDDALNELVGSLDERVKKSGVNLSVSLDEAHHAVIDTHEIEVDLYVDSLTTAIEDTKAVTQNYNFYGTVGSVQTGANASANVIQNLGSEDRGALVSAIQQVRDAIANSSFTREQQRKELLEIADDCTSQIAASSPNNTKLLTMFTVLGTAIQSIASAQPAYQALKVAVLPLGITLP